METECYDELWKPLLHTESFAAVLISSSGKVIRCNKGFLQMFAISPSGYKGKSLFSLIESKELQEQFTEFNAINQVHAEFLFSFTILSGSICWSKVEVARVEENSRYLLIFRDLTEAYQAQMIMEAHSMVSDDIFLFFDHSSHVLHCSEKAALLFGFPSGREVMGVHYTTLMQGRINLKAVEEALRQLHQQNGYRGYIALRQGKHRFFELSGFHVQLRSVSVGFVLLFKALGSGTFHLMSSNKEQELLRESEVSEENYTIHEWMSFDTASLYWDSKECKDRLMELYEALKQYEYVEINRLLEQIIMLAPKRACHRLQMIQNAIMKFEYEQAITLFQEAQFVIET